MSRGKCVILCAPSGSGKTTLVKHLLDQNEMNLIFSISATTRKIRKGEENGKDYFYFTNEKFIEKINNEDFLEYEEVYNGIFYGTLKDSVEDLRDRGFKRVEQFSWQNTATKTLAVISK